MQVLTALARHRGRVVSRDHLNQICWGGRIVGEDALQRCIGRVRKLARSHGGFTVHTVAFVGYRLDEAGAAGPETRPVPPGHPIAQDLLHRARTHHAVGGETFTLQAMLLLEEAVRCDPSHGEAWALLAHARARMRGCAPDAQEADRLLATGRTAAARARVFGHDSGLADAAMALLCPPYADQPAREALLRQGLARRPNDPHLLMEYAASLAAVGRLREATVIAAQAQPLDPQNAQLTMFRASTQIETGETAMGFAELERMLARWPEAPGAVEVAVIYYARAGDWDRVDELLSPARLQRFPLLEHAASATAAAALRRNPTALQREDFIARLRRRIDRTGHLPPSSVALAGEIGLVDEIFDLTASPAFRPGRVNRRRAVDWGTVSLFCRATLPLCHDPRFAALSARYGLAEYWLETDAWPDFAAEAPYDLRAACEAAVAAQAL